MHNLFNRSRARLMARLSFAAVLFTAAPPDLHAANSWAKGYGMAGYSLTDDGYFTGLGKDLSVIVNVQSNTTYFIASSRGAGNPILGPISFKTDMAAATLKFMTVTQTFELASNAIFNTNILWLSKTNTGLATNDVCILEDRDNDFVQLVLISGNATDAGGLVYTNALGQNGIKVWNGVSNALAGTTKLHKLAAVSSFSPLTFPGLTNSGPYAVGYTNILGVSTPYGNWLPLAFSLTGPPLKFRGPIGLPCALVLTASNASGGGLYVEGDYGRQPPRR